MYWNWSTVTCRWTTNWMSGAFNDERRLNGSTELGTSTQHIKITIDFDIWKGQEEKSR